MRAPKEMYIKMKDLDMSKFGDEYVNMRRLKKLFVKSIVTNRPPQKYRAFKRALEELDYRQTFLAESIGVGQGTLSQMVNGEKSMSDFVYESLKTICDNKIYAPAHLRKVHPQYPENNPDYKKE